MCHISGKPEQAAYVADMIISQRRTQPVMAMSIIWSHYCLMKIFHSEEEASRDTHANGVAAARVISYPPVVPGVRWDFSVLCSLCC